MLRLRNWGTPYLWVVLWPLLALVASALLWAGVARQAHSTRNDAQQAALKEMLAISQAYEQYLGRSFAHVDQVTMQLKQSLEASGGTLDLARLTREGMFHDEGLACVAYRDASGRVRSAVREPACAPIVRRAAIAVYHAGNNSSAMRVSGAGEQDYLIFSRRVDTADDDFAGVVMLVMRADYFTGFNIASTTARGGSVSAAGTEATWHASSAASPAQRSLMARSRAATDEHGAAIAGGQVFGWSRSPAYPVIGMVAVPDRVISEPVQAAAVRARRDAWLGTFVFGLLGVLGAVLSRRAADRYSAQEDVRRAYRAATEGAHDGFYMATPVRDRHGLIRDFEIVDCNERGAGFYGVTRQAMIGKRLSMLERAGDGLFASYLAAMEQGFHEDECRMPAHQQVRLAWGHRRIVRVGTGLAITLRDLSERQSHIAELDRLSNEDVLTGLPNRRWLLAWLPPALAQAAGEVALLFIDVSDIKHVNDTHGHAVGDQLLHACAQRLQSLLRPDDVVVRFGGDEFVVVLAPAEGDLHSARVAERIVNAFAAPFALGSTRVMTGACVGISVFPRDGSDSNDLIRHADIAMEAGKAEGKERYRFYEASLSRSLQGRQRMKQDLLAAIEQDQFVLYYQPRVDVESGALCSMEALIRWVHPEQGVIAPLDFIPLAESSGLILPLGELVMDKAAAQLAAWRAAGLPLLPVSVNVSPRQFTHGALPAQLAATLQRHGLHPALLEVEITESAMMGDQQHILAQLDAIRALGIKLHVDDFGTGYSSLSQLQKLRMDVLKVDRAFTSELGQSREGQVFFQAIVSMAHALGMTVVAEGVETEQQLVLLRELGCNEVQGYFIGRPQPASDMAALLAQALLPAPLSPSLTD